MSDFVALHPINAPGSYARGYNTGDAVPAQVVDDWGLAVGDDVEPADGYDAPRPADGNDDRAAWEAYVVAKGTTVADAKAASLDELRGMYEPPPPPEPPAHDLPASVSPEGVDGTGVQNATQFTADNIPTPTEPLAEDTPERPAQSARKVEWVEYVVALGADWRWADAATKDDLVTWKPEG